ncbi:MAG TPA: glycoside hydrolase family 172 protein [Cyclobacteriaceae bacterium]|nr:glycoside hydrolase family 172 protein [Cyclobacteriaceae bacterium]
MMRIIKLFIPVLLIWTFSFLQAQELYQMPAGQHTRWSSFENPTAGKGKGGAENKGAKGHPAELISPGASKILLDVKGAGIIQRMWMTISDRSPAMLRSIRLEMYWDGSTKPAVSVPLGDFFGVGLGRKVAFQNALFSDPEGRSFNCYIPMPFRTAAKIQIVNDSDKPFTLFYDINFQQVEKHAADVLYFHSFWRRENKTQLGNDFEILPNVKGKGRYLGMNMGIITDPVYEKSWWGEGEVKIYLDGDSDLPTLNGTGSEDYIGTGWGQGVFVNQYQGCLVADQSIRQWAFYRYHIPDAIFFQRECRVTIQIMGGDMLNKVREYKKNGAALIPVTISSDNDFFKFFEQNPVPDLMDPKLPDGWTNFYRQDDVSATVYFYLDKPVSELPPVAPRGERIAALPEKY